MKMQNNPDTVAECMGTEARRENFFGRFSPNVMRSFEVASHYTLRPAGVLLFTEGQTPGGVYIICSGQIKLFITSRDGKVLALKRAEVGAALGASAVLSATNYEVSAETSTVCQLNFISRQDLIRLMNNHSEVALDMALFLSQEVNAAWRDKQALTLSRSCSGKLARLLLSCAPKASPEVGEPKFPSMTQEEMAQRIGSSRETITRLLSTLRTKRLIQLDGSTMMIRDRAALKNMAD